jgi:hypothetical protein
MTYSPMARLNPEGALTPAAAAERGRYFGSWPTAAGAAPEATAWAGGPSPGRCSHSGAALYFSLVIIHTKYTGWCQNDCNVYA